MTPARSFLNALVLLAAIPLAGPPGTRAQPLGMATSSEGRSPENFTQVSLQAFDHVWSTVVDRVWNEQFDLETWEEAKTELRPHVETATNIDEVREILHQLLSRLQLSHYSIIAGDIYAEFHETTSSDRPDGNWGESGVSVRIVNGAACIAEVAQGSDAFLRGVRPGWQLVTVRGKNVSKFIEQLQTDLSRRSAYRMETQAALMIEAQLAGSLHEAIPMTCLDTAKKTRHVEIKLNVPTGQKVKFGYLPPIFVRAEAREVEPGIGYVRFNSFFAPGVVMPALSTAMATSEQGLIIDLRGNRGGLAAMTIGLGSRLVSEQQQFLGIHKMKDVELKYVLTPSANPHTGPLAVLVDECSISSAEILAGGLQAIGRARVFGSTSAGAALPSMVTRLPNGDFFQFAIADFVDANGKQIEGTGVIPDEPVPLRLGDLIEDRDPALEAAVTWLQSTVTEDQPQ